MMPFHTETVLFTNQIVNMADSHRPAISNG
jgi:hypothetical protein